MPTGKIQDQHEVCKHRDWPYLLIWPERKEQLTDYNDFFLFKERTIRLIVLSQNKSKELDLFCLIL